MRCHTGMKFLTGRYSSLALKMKEPGVVLPLIIYSSQVFNNLMKVNMQKPLNSSKPYPRSLSFFEWLSLY